MGKQTTPDYYGAMEEDDRTNSTYKSRCCLLYLVGRGGDNNVLFGTKFADRYDGGGGDRRVS